MLETMYAADGVGLAGPQVGVGERIIVIDVGEGPIVLINPGDSQPNRGGTGCGRLSEYPRPERLCDQSGQGKSGRS